MFEKKAAVFSLGERDWNMGLHWGVPILKSLIPESAVAQLQSTQVDPNAPTKPLDTLAFLNGKTGEVMSAPQIPNFHRLRRSKLRALLSQGLDIRWNKRLKDIVFEHDGKSVTAVFEDGQHITGRLIIGADGSKSSVRRVILGPEPAATLRLPYSATFVQARYTREQALFLRSFHPLYIAAPHPDGLFAFFGLQDAPEVDKPENWTFFFYISWNSPIEQQAQEASTMGNRERVAQVKKLATGYTEPWKSAFQWVGDDQPVWYFDLAVWDPSLPEHKWNTGNGRVTLAGDAAHPMTYRTLFGRNSRVMLTGHRTRARSKPRDSRCGQACGTFDFRIESSCRYRKIRNRNEDSSWRRGEIQRHEYDDAARLEQGTREPSNEGRTAPKGMITLDIGSDIGTWI
jgi:hypothetical protein